MSRIAIAAAVLAFWVALGLIQAGFQITDPLREEMTWHLSWRYSLPPWLLFAVLTPALGVLARRFPMTPAAWLRHTPIHAVCAVVFVIVHLAATNVTVNLLLGNPPFPFVNLPSAIARYTGVDLFIYVAIVAGFHVLHYYRESRDRAIATSRLEASLAEARLQALRTQVEPHFLFNTLNAVSTLAMRGDHQAVVATVGHLGQLLRGTLEEGRAQEIQLHSELEMLEPYLAIQRVRFGNRLTVTLEIPEEARDALVPSLILQPLVENAVRHGIAGVDGGWIEIRAAHRGDRLALEVQDSGGVPELPGSGNGVGLANTRARLTQLYGNAQSFELAALPGGGAVARLSVPWRLRRPEPVRPHARTS